MDERTYAAARRLARRAARLEGARGRLPALFAFTDPLRTPDPAALAQALPPGSGLILRTFGRPHLAALAAPLADIARRGGLTLLIAADPALARQVGAHGVHWPEARLSAFREHRRHGMTTASAHSPRAFHQAQTIADAVFISPVFASNSPSAGRALGPFRAAAALRGAQRPVYALGGVDGRSVMRLKGLGFSGIAAVEGLTR